MVALHDGFCIIFTPPIEARDVRAISYGKPVVLIVKRPEEPSPMRNSGVKSPINPLVNDIITSYDRPFICPIDDTDIYSQ